ncbi:MAG: AI-2E family transporter [Amaricoccus sp.]|uniref:AI-2E family transporter n=1 Tax=Amaricoccus sp. TaxID=1872485 RepID=UPI0039E26AEF
METELQHKAFLLLLAVVSVAFFWLLLPFYGAVFWAVILAIVFNPLQRRLERRFGVRSTVAALLSVLVCVVIAIIPMSVILGALVSEGAALVARVQENQYDPGKAIQDLHAAMPPWLDTTFDRLGMGDFDALRDRLVSIFQQVSQFLATRAFTFGSNTLRFIASVGVMLYVLFFLFRDGRAIGRNVLACMPMSDAKNRALIHKFAAVVRATVKGNIAIAVIQGVIGGVAFWLLGIQGALLWGALMIFLSLLPAVGSALIWLPAAVYLIATGAVSKGLILVAVGVGVIGLVDNLLRPKLVGADTKMPDYVILVSTLGGISIFGINGFVIGPLIAALFMAAWTIFRDEKPVPVGEPRAARRRLRPR